MGFLDGIVKRVERRALREAENLAVGRLKGYLFGEKREKIEIPVVVEYGRIELRMKDLLGCFVELNNVIRKEYLVIHKKRIVENLRRMKELYSKMLEGEKGKNHLEIVKEVELLLGEKK